jgi:hypothetical protein
MEILTSATEATIKELNVSHGPGVSEVKTYTYLESQRCRPAEDPVSKPGYNGVCVGGSMGGPGRSNS